MRLARHVAVRGRGVALLVGVAVVSACVAAAAAAGSDAGAVAGPAAAAGSSAATAVRANSMPPEAVQGGQRWTRHRVRATPAGRARAKAARAARTVEQDAARDRIHVWVPTWERASVLESLRANGAWIGHASPFWFTLGARGDRIVAARGAWDPQVLQIATEQSIELTPTVSNSFDRVRLGRMLRSPSLRHRHVTQLTALVADPMFAGLDVDYENLAVRDRALFTRFATELAAALHAQGKTLSMTLMAATGPRSGSIGAAATDYAGIGAVADEVRVMAYDYHWSCGAPGPIAPIDWVERVAAYVSSVVPPEKVVLGMPLYGYDWPKRGCAASRTWQSVQAISSAQRGAQSWSGPWATPTLRYGRRTVWFEQADSSIAKADVAREHGLRGVAMWRIGGEDPETWPAVGAALADDPSITGPTDDTGDGSTSDPSTTPPEGTTTAAVGGSATP